MATTTTTSDRRSAPSGTAAALRANRRRRAGRSIVVTCALTATVAALFVLTMMVGSFRIGAAEVIASVLHLSDNPSVDFVVRGLRLPTAAAALTVGLALGASGTIFQQLLRNPLASPDFVGITSGAGLAAVTGIVLLQAGGLVVSGLALGGAVAAALAMYLLAWRDGVSGYRFILIGIGVAVFFEGLIGYVLSRAQLFEARQAMHWLIGSVGQASTTSCGRCTGALIVLLPLATLLQRPAESPRSSVTTPPGCWVSGPSSAGPGCSAPPSCWWPSRWRWRARSPSSPWWPGRSPTGSSAPPPRASCRPHWSVPRCC